MTKHELALKLGNHILDSIDRMKAEKKDFGSHLRIPFKPGYVSSDELDFVYSLTLAMPQYIQMDSDGIISSITMAEYFGWEK